MEYTSIGIAAVTLVVLLVDRVFGSGRSITKEFAGLEFRLAAQITELRNETQEKRETAIANNGEALRGVREQMHLLENKHLEYRAFAAETYMRRDAYYRAAEEIKTDMKNGFDKIETRLDRMEKNGHR